MHILPLEQRQVFHALRDAVPGGAQPQRVDLVLLVDKLEALLQLFQVVAKVLD